MVSGDAFDPRHASAASAAVAPAPAAAPPLSTLAMESPFLASPPLAWARSTATGSQPPAPQRSPAMLPPLGRLLRFRSRPPRSSRGARLHHRPPTAPMGSRPTVVLQPQPRTTMRRWPRGPMALPSRRRMAARTRRPTSRRRLRRMRRMLLPPRRPTPLPRCTPLLLRSRMVRTPRRHMAIINNHRPMH